MIADIAVDQSGWAEWCFIIAAVLFVVAAVLHFARHNRSVITPTTEGTRRGIPGWSEPVLQDIGLALIAVGLLVL